MERTLGNVVNQSQKQSQGQDQGFSTQSFNTYLTVFSINLSLRFQDVTDLNAIDYQSVRRIAEFSAACSSIALEVWDELSTDVQKRQRQTRAA